MGDQGQWQMPDGAQATFTWDPATNTLLIDNNGDVPLQGQLGDSIVSVGTDGVLSLQFTPNGFTCDPQGDVTQFDAGTGEFQPLPEGETVTYTEEPLPPPPLVDPSEGGTLEQPPPPPPPGEESMLPPPPPPSGDMPPPDETATNIGTTSTFREFRDNFDRPDGTFIANGWVENFGGGGADLLLSSGVVFSNLLSGQDAFITRDFVHLPRFEATAGFEYLGLIVSGSMQFEVGMNFDPFVDLGVFAVYQTDGSSGWIGLEGGDGSFSFSPAGAVGLAVPFRLSLKFGGGNGCARIELPDGTLLGQHCAPALDGPGTHIDVGAENNDISPHTIKIDNVRVTELP